MKHEYAIMKRAKFGTWVRANEVVARIYRIYEKRFALFHVFKIALRVFATAYISMVAYKKKTKKNMEELKEWHSASVLRFVCFVLRALNRTPNADSPGCITGSALFECFISLLYLLNIRWGQCSI